MKRVFRIHFKGGSFKDLELARATKLKLRNDYEVIHLDKLEDGRFRLTFTESLVEDFSQVENIEVLRG